MATTLYQRILCRNLKGGTISRYVERIACVYFNVFAMHHIHTAGIWTNKEMTLYPYQIITITSSSVAQEQALLHNILQWFLIQVSWFDNVRRMVNADMLKSLYFSHQDPVMYGFHLLVARRVVPITIMYQLIPQHMYEFTLFAELSESL